jgi:DNA processing protein
LLGVGVEGPVGTVSADARLLADAPTMAASEADRTREREAWAVLAGVDGLGPLVFSMLLRRVGSGRAILDLAGRVGGSLALAAVAGERPPDEGPAGPVLTGEVATAIAAAANDAARTLDRVGSLGLRIVTLDDADYPARLGAVDLPPHVLFVRGSTEALHGVHAVAVVGTRRASTGGRALAGRIAGALVASDAVVVSGLAIGIDGAAHAATLAAGGRTVAVIGTGHAHLYPRAHARLAAAIVDGGGAIVSELVPDTGPRTWTFPRRNRLISGLADATVVVEAPARSGALLTASWSMEQGRDCFLVPGTIDAVSHAGCLAFLREFPGSARIVSGVPQLIEDLGLAAAPASRGSTRLANATLAELGGTAALVGRELVAGRVTVDELVAVTGLPVATILATLTLLERRGLVAGAFGRYRPAGTLALAGSRTGRPRRRRPGTTA